MTDRPRLRLLEGQLRQLRRELWEPDVRVVPGGLATPLFDRPREERSPSQRLADEARRRRALGGPREARG